MAHLAARARWDVAARVPWAACAVVGDGTCFLATPAVGGPCLAWPSGGSGARALAVERRGGGGGGPDWRHGGHGTGAPGGLATLPRLMSSWIPLSGFLDSISFFDFLFDRFVYGLRSNRYIFIDFW